MSAEGYANSGNYYVHILGLHSGVDVKFQAMLTNFSDNWTSKYNPEEVYGRMDPIMTFQNTTRKMTIYIHLITGKWHLLMLLKICS